MTQAASRASRVVVALIIAAILVLIGVVAARRFHRAPKDDASVEAPSVDEPPTPDDQWRKTEEKLTATRPNIQRKDSSLIIHAGTMTQTYTDRRDPNDPNTWLETYALSDVIDVGGGREDYVVWHQFYEGHQVLLINGRDGRSAILADKPVLSPAHDRYLIDSFDIDAGYNPCELRVIRSADFSDEFVLNFDADQPPLKGGADGARWVTNDSVAFFNVWRKEMPPDMRAPYLLEFKNGKWGYARTGPDEVLTSTE